MNRTSREALVQQLPTFAAIAGLLLLSIGMWVYAPWLDLTGDRLLDLAIAAAALVACVSLVARVAGIGAFAACALAVIAAMIVFAGPAPVVATGVLLLAAVGIGTWPLRDESIPAAMPVVFGLALIAATLGWLLPLPLHTDAVYAIACALVIFVRRTQILAWLGTVRMQVDQQSRAAPVASVACMAMIFFASMPGWLPAMMPDDAAFHLQLWKQLEAFGLARFDARTQVWSMAAWAGDIIHTVPALMSGEEAHGPVNLLFVLTTCALVWQLATAMRGAAAVAWWSAAIYASLPLSAMLVMGMQTELPSAMVCAALAVLIQRRSRHPQARVGLGVVLLVGFAIGLKAINLLFVLPLLAWLVVMRPRAWSLRGIATAVPLVLAVGASSYTYAWIVTGNPVLPALNGVFGSEYFAPHNFSDSHWGKGFQGDILWRITFDASSYFEGFAGAAGFVWVVLAAATIAALFRTETRGVALCGAVATLASLTMIHYMRYAHPSLVLVIPAALVALQAAAGVGWQVRVVAVSLCLLHLPFHPSANWMLRNGALRVRILHGEATTLAIFAPDRALLERVGSMLERTDRVLISGWSALSELPDKAFIASWYDPQTSARINNTVDTWSDAIRGVGATHVLLNETSVHDSLREAIARLGATEVARLGPASLHRIPVPAIEGIDDGIVDGRQVLRWSLPGSAQLGEARVEARCSPSGTQFAYGWILTTASGKSLDTAHQWAQCDAQGRVEFGVEALIPHAARELQFNVKPADEAAQSELRIDSGTLALRPDAKSERWATRGIARHLCGLKACREAAAPAELWIK